MVYSNDERGKINAWVWRNYTRFEHRTRLHHFDKTQVVIVSGDSIAEWDLYKTMAIDFLSATAAMKGLSSAVVMLVIG